ncbi:cytochrome b [Aureimonas sp. N4]|uniref:cytochrome b n=1 Tax=Aureimonas sp. N4 TaxID=1638165 RepID=UPI000780EEFA|nr:cytochrome b/b6 domain-containing protein [Aureimonas sp. N4]
MVHPVSAPALRYPLSLRVLHWSRAVLILGLIACGWFMTGRAEDDAVAAWLYPNHKQFGLLVWLLAMVHLVVRWRERVRLPREAHELRPWERKLSMATQRLMIALTFLTPMFGYAMSSVFTQSDGVPFFVVSRLPEFLPKNDALFPLFQTLHRYSAYILLTCVALHVAGALKHRVLHAGGERDVLTRML